MAKTIAEELVREGYLKTKTIIDAFVRIKRVDFVPADLEEQAEANIPLPIGFGQTISQPLTVAFMLELLEPQSGQIILDVGSGSGWTTALLAHITGEKGKVVGVERIPELMEIGKKNVDKYGFVKKGIIEFHLGDGSKGFERHVPYDRILVSAAGREIPKPLIKQLKIGGKMVIPVHNSIWYLEKSGEDDIIKEEYPGFAFVPLIENSR